MDSDVTTIIRGVLADAMPDTSVKRALDQFKFPDGRLIAVSVGKAAWKMAHAASCILGKRIERGIVITKYGHCEGEIPDFLLREAGHPIPDENGFRATADALKLVSGLGPEDAVLLLLSGGGSALFELPLIPADELADINRQLLASGADITQINTVRKRLSAVKGGRFALKISPARVYTIALSDVLGDAADSIASGPACPDPSTCADCERIIRQYSLRLSTEAEELLHRETPKQLDNAVMLVTGSVKQLCLSAVRITRELGYEPILLTDSLQGEARQFGTQLGALARSKRGSGKKIALIAGGETVVHITGTGLGGRNQEIALASAEEISGCPDVCVFSFGSDGTDGPTDAAGGYTDGTTCSRLKAAGLSAREALNSNDSYHALKKVDGLIMTGPTGTNVNDLSVALIRN